MTDDACECLIILTIPSDSSVEARIEASRLTTLSGRLQTFGSGFRRPPDACSHRIPAAKSRTCSWNTMSGSDLRSSCFHTCRETKGHQLYRSVRQQLTTSGLPVFLNVITCVLTCPEHQSTRYDIPSYRVSGLVQFVPTDRSCSGGDGYNLSTPRAALEERATTSRCQAFAATSLPSWGTNRERRPEKCNTE